MRLFIAIPLPKTVREKLSDLYQPMEGVRWQQESQLHITLKFLGETDKGQVSPLIRALSDIQLSSFKMTIRRFGFFPAKGRPKIIWVGIDNPEQVYGLQQRIEQKCVDMGYESEDRPFKPHITLGRIQGVSRREMLSFVDQHKQFILPDITVDKFILFGSQLHPDGAIHKKVEIFPLMGN